MKKNKIVIGVTGGIAIYKILELISRLRKSGYDLHVIMTPNATQFISPLTFETISQNKVWTDTFEKENPLSHIQLAELADIFLIAPATYNVIGKIANGIADNLLTTTAAVVQSKKYIAPAMNVHMYHNNVLQNNLDILKNLGYQLIEPESGYLACGYEGKGRLANIEKIYSAITSELRYPVLKGKSIIVTAGGTIEPIDPVRMIVNHSSGKMGIALAEAASHLGGEVTLIYGNIQSQVPQNMTTIHTLTAIDMLTELQSRINETDILIMAAAVADYRVKNISHKKLKKDTDNLTIELMENPDLLKTLSQHKKPGQIFIGFAAESEGLLENASAKLVKKGLDMIIANDISRSDIGFQSDENEVQVIFKDKRIISLPKMSKSSLSYKILELIATM